MHQHVFEKFPNVHIYLIGGGTHLGYYQEKIDKLQLNDKITLTGSKTNPYPYLKQADLLISPSKKESFGLVMMEAMLLGIPVIATATTGAKYVTQNGKYACCVDNNDEALREAVCQFLDDPASYKYPKTEAQEWVRQHDTAAFGQRLLQLMEECENKHGSR